MLDYQRPPIDVIKFVQGLPHVLPVAKGIAPDSLLDRELVQTAIQQADE
jgi:hypothetical protein